jgi:hypothetical protein
MRSPLCWLKRLDPPVIIALLATDLRNRSQRGGELHSAANFIRRPLQSAATAIGGLR